MSWKNVITRYGSPLYKNSLDEDTLKLAIAERRALKVISRRDGFGSGEVYFERAQMGDTIEGYDEKWIQSKPFRRYRFCIVFPQPGEITDEELSSLQQSAYAWERVDEFFEEIDWILAIKCWKSLITRYGPPLEPESFDEDALKLAITERRAIKVIDFGYGYDIKLYLDRAQMSDAIRGHDEKRAAPYFCIVFPRPCDITDEDLRTMHGSWDRWKKVRKDIDGILATECWKSLTARYGPPLKAESLDEDTLKLAIAERRALRFVRKKTSTWHGRAYLERAEVGDAIKGYAMNSCPDSLSCLSFSIVFRRPCEVTDEEIKTLGKVIMECGKVCEFTDPSCKCYQTFFSWLAARYSFG